jgi:hypothetical protein
MLNIFRTPAYAEEKSLHLQMFTLVYVFFHLKRAYIIFSRKNTVMLS